MTGRHQRLQALFEQVRSLPIGTRDELLRTACGDDQSLHDEVLELLHADAATSLLDGDVAELLTTNESRSHQPPRIANYRLVDRIASGGMGDVYRAHQLAPVQRTVALKVLRPVLAGSNFTARFENERQLVARMQHTGIAQLFESGVSEDGCPFFAMELVEGEPITRFCDHHRLTIGARLGLFASVCETVHYAHEQGVVHRDLKPGNVLAKMQDGRPIAKVIDFGIAHSADLQDDRHAILGTPGYVSPERLRGGADAPSSDVYALGVLLRELTIGKAQPDAAIAQPTCSAALRDADDAATIAATRKTTTSHLARECRRDLDWLVSCATAIDPASRYASALELATDVRRYLAAQPTNAHPDSISYRFERRWRRNRAAMSAGAIALVGLAVAGGIGISGWNDRQRANDSIDEASRVLFERSIDDELANLPGSDPARIELVQSGLELSTQALTADPSNRELQERVLRARKAWARLLMKLGRTDEATDTLRQALANDVALADESLRASAHLTLISVLRRNEQLDEADRAADELMQSLKVTVTDPWPRRALGASAWRERALNARRRNDPDAAYRAAQQAVTFITDPPEGVEHWALLWKRVDIYKIVAEIAADLPDEPYARFFELALDNLDELRRLHRRAKLDHMVALIYDSWAYAEVQRERFDEVARHDAKALRAIEPLLADFPDRVPYQETWLRVQRRRARAKLQGGDKRAAAQSYDAAINRGATWLAAAPQSRSLDRLVAMLRRERERLP